MVIIKRSRPVFLFKLVFEIRFSDVLLATEVIGSGEERKFPQLGHVAGEEVGNVRYMFVQHYDLWQ